MEIMAEDKNVESLERLENVETTSEVVSEF